MKLSSKISTPYKDGTLLQYLVGRFTYLSAEQWRERLAEGRVVYEGKIGLPDMRVRQGATVIYDVPPFPQPDANFDYSIIFEDEWLLAVNKPANLRVHGKGRFMMANLTYHLRHVGVPTRPSINLVNRLDTDTSGIVLLAKDKTSAQKMGLLFREHQIKKEYLALAHGVIKQAKGKLNQPLQVRKGKQGVPRTFVDHEHGKPAATDFEVIERFPKDNCTFVKLQPITGRTHQLRSHMAAFGHRLVGDRRYALNDQDYIDWREGSDDPRFHDLLPRQALHASRIRFIHPHTAQPFEITAPLPTDFANLLSQLTSS